MYDIVLVGIAKIVPVLKKVPPLVGRIIYFPMEKKWGVCRWGICEKNYPNWAINYTIG
ncbi:MAG: hypothetical protein ABI113_04450 [Mucilaginibacter sp.]